jgi:hypothetical protein
MEDAQRELLTICNTCTHRVSFSGNNTKNLVLFLRCLHSRLVSTLQQEIETTSNYYSNCRCLMSIYEHSESDSLHTTSDLNQTPVILETIPEKKDTLTHHYSHCMPHQL